MNKDQQKTLIKYVNDTPILVSLFYDLNMLPEDLDSKSEDFEKMLKIAEAFMNFGQINRSNYF